MSGRRRENEALILIGSNIEPERWVPRALALLRARFDVRATSAWYRSPAVGGTAPAPDFVNLAVRLRTDCFPRALREAARRIEEACERRRTVDRYAPRTMDLDVVWMQDRVEDLGAWRLPDPALLEEAFVLVPCAEAAPDAVHPAAAATLAALAEGLPTAKKSALVRTAPPPATDGAA